MSEAVAYMDIVFLARGAAVELQHLRYFALWSLGENLRSGSPDRMMVLSSRALPPWRRYLGGPNDRSYCCAWLRVVWLVVVVRPAWGRWWFVLLHVFLFSCPSRGLHPVALHAQDPPMVVVVRAELRALGVVLIDLCSMTTQ